MEPRDQAPFAGARHKVARAREHRDDLHAETGAFLKPGGGDERPHGVAFHRERRQGFLVVKASFIAEEPPPVRLSLIGGDLANNLRTALDYFVADLKRSSGASKQQLREGSFPVTTSAKDFANRSEQALSGILQDSDAWRAIEEAQPFHTDRPHAHPLAVLVHMNNADKHRLLQPAFVYPSVADGLEHVVIHERDRCVAESALWKAGEPLEHGTPLAELRFAPGASDHPVGANQGPTLKVSFGELLSDTRVTFDEMISTVDSIVSRGPDLASERRTP